MKVIVCGGRTFGHPVDGTQQAAIHAGKQRALIYKILEQILGYPASMGILTLIEGEANGADLASKAWAETKTHVKIIPEKADWEKHGKAAGAIRNKVMLNHGPSLVIAFPGGRGTENMIYQAKQQGVPVLRVEI